MTYFVSSSLSRRWSEQHFIVFLPAITFRPNYEKFFLSVVLELLCWISLTFLETKDKGLGVLEFRPLLRRMRAFSSIDRKKGSHLRIIIRWASLKNGPLSFSRFGDDKKRAKMFQECGRPPWFLGAIVHVRFRSARRLIPDLSSWLAKDR